MKTQQLTELVARVLDDSKAEDIQVLDVREMTSITDTMVIASGTSGRHVKALSSHVAEEAKKAGITPLGTEGEVTSEWVLVDLGDVVVHVMLPDAREFYNLEKLWSVLEHDRKEAVNAPGTVS